MRTAEDADFQALGLVPRGDILALKSFVPLSHNAKEERKTKLLKLTHLLGTTSTKSKAASSRERSRPSADDSQSTPSKQIQSVKKIQIGWKHYNEKEKRHVSVRLNRGGGTRELSVPVQSSFGEVLPLMKEVYFPDGISSFGVADIMTFKVGNFQGEEAEEEFTLANYIAKYKLTKVRLYLLTRNIDEDQDSELMTPAFENDHVMSDDGLKGSSDERKSLREMQDEEYLDSLRRDQEKEQAKREELLRCQEKIIIQEKLREAREIRVPPEPDISEQHVTVSVRHVAMGIVTRRFPKSGHVGNVYDWVGSLSLIPEYFTLSMVGSLNLDPALHIDVVDQAMLSMLECDKSPSFPDETVCFHGFGPATEISSEEYMCEPVSEKSPLVLMDEDEV